MKPVFLCLSMLWAHPVFAEFTFCNQTLDVANLAVGSYRDDSLETSGWWVVGPNQCARVDKRVLRSRYYYIFAQDVFGRVLLEGATPMCVGANRFRIRGESDCLARGFIEARFFEVDTKNADSWTFFLRDPGLGG